MQESLCKPAVYFWFCSDQQVQKKIVILHDILQSIGEIESYFEEEKSFKLESAQKIIGTRNRIVHGYDKISDDLIWSIVINHLPKLKAEIQSLIQD